MVKFYSPFLPTLGTLTVSKYAKENNLKSFTSASIDIKHFRTASMNYRVFKKKKREETHRKLQKEKIDFTGHLFSQL